LIAAKSIVVAKTLSSSCCTAGLISHYCLAKTKVIDVVIDAAIDFVIDEVSQFGSQNLREIRV